MLQSPTTPCPCLTCGSMQTYPNEMYPPNQTQWFRALLHNVSLTCGRMQTYPNEMYPPKLIPVLQSPITPCPFDMWKHSDIPKWDVFPPNQTQCFIAVLHHVCLTCGSMQTYPNEMYSPLIKPSASEPYYTMSVWQVEACRHTQMRCISPNQTQCFRALLHNICLTCGSM